MQTPEHIAIIMDGNGRWAKEHGKAYGKTEFVSGFVRFVKLAVKIKTKHLNRDNEGK